MAGTMNQEQFKKLVLICKRFDPFTQYIDNYTQMKQADANNEILEKEYQEIVKPYGITQWWVPCTNDGEKTEENLKQWLLSHEVSVEQEVKRIWTEEEIKHLVQNDDRVLYRALKKLYSCQTSDEQNSAETTHKNGAGFNALDAEFLTSVSKFLLKNGYLTPKQKVIVRKKLVKYNKQLTRLANA